MIVIVISGCIATVNHISHLFLKDFEALTPNLPACTVETVEGGGIVCLLLRTMNSLKQLYTLNLVRKLQCNVFEPGVSPQLALGLLRLVS